jgi:tRNA(Ile2) C34 agmatinyltransferase TiaS
MIYVGIDDTDTLDDPGTNQLARHLVRELAGQFIGRMILRHQLLEDPRVPCTKKNGCASIQFELEPGPTGAEPEVADSLAQKREQLIVSLRDIIIPWCPAGSDPGFCVATTVPPAVTEWGARCQRELVTQAEARTIAADAGIYLEGLGGTEDGVIGALAAVGLMSTKNDGRVIYFGASSDDWYDVTGVLEVEDILSRGVNEVLTAEGNQTVVAGTVDVGKRLRPNFRGGRIVLYVARGENPYWEAVRML